MKVKKILLLFLLLVASVLILLGCGTTSKNTSPSGENTGSFNITGILSGAMAPSSIVNAAESANYVYAVNTCPEYGSVWRKKVLLNPDGSFEISLTKGDPWILAFIDTNETGAAMIKGIFKAESLDCIAPKAAVIDGKASIGTLNIDVSGNAEISSENYDTFIGNLGMLDAEATMLGQMDDLMLRYINPDMNNNGVLDMDEGTHVNITFWSEFNYGNNLLTANVRAGQPIPTNQTPTFRGVHPQLRVFDDSSKSHLSGLPPKWSLTWTEQGSFVAADMYEATDLSATFVSGNPGHWVSYDGEAVSAKIEFPSHVTKVPEGTYTYRLYNGLVRAPALTFEFTNVKTPADASYPTNFVFPFPVFNVDSSGNITSIDYTWKKYNGTGFVNATSGELEMILGKKSASIKWYEGLNKSCYIMIKPHEQNFPLTGTIPVSAGYKDFDGPTARDNITKLTIAFETRMGMLMNMSID
ncbi:MAG: hypothetical protein DKM50_13655 [Candidatus Margulisiibacteriota bacterium]|nr:MAG: hypothetical protein A2X43_05390 [Candidatus Margulisbacteria bacterium GWD2_39_127]OGI03423.1 MAG: hypothetical protein A2X42_05085 [Candidatus Margulisbacteria bacterium GWF2_38_17]PZM77251.1 MAG: hypothetical protein DKM50_13655 [Candidatus Margulisiibacteriota bacterium]HAR64475.1 hypothetical protein [Candidatus Margulisiibacteriota bacterium]HCY36504.1 hypothetical protein [Candidatus Margulisiibacteriota bacterium]